MRRLALLVLAAGVLLGSCSNTLRVTGTAPSLDNDGTCAAPVLLAAPPATVRMVHVSWSGPATGEDSLSVSAGSPFTFTRSVPSGTYVIRAWASDAGGAGCDTTITRTLKAPPWKVALQ